jgi:integrase
VPFSDIIKAELADHLERLDPDDGQALVFTSPMGAPLRHSNFYRRAWLPAVAKAGLPGIHFHDLRHAGNTLTEVSLRELMDRMGHSSTRAALIYQHSSDERQRKLADAVGEAARAALGKTAPASGTHVAHEASDQS